MASSKYYSSIYRSGNQLCVREIRDGKRRKFRVEYQPTLYVPSKKKTKITAPDGTFVDAVKPGSMFECYNFVKKSGFQVYGNTSYEYAFLNEEYTGHIDYNIADLVVLNLDIEVSSKGGFSTAENADQEVTAITIKNSKDGIFHVFACKEFSNVLPEVRYYECSDERDLLERFLCKWEEIEPDIVTGWNCVPVSSHVWGAHKIVNIDTLCIGDSLYDSNVIRTFPTSKKAVWQIECKDGRIIESSKDHVFPTRWKNRAKYSKLTGTGKDLSMGGDLPVESIRRLVENNDVYCQVLLGNNQNQDRIHPTLGIPISHDLCYVLGCLFTDGSISYKDHVASFYNDNLDIFNRIYKILDSYKSDRCRRPGDGITQNKKTKRCRSSLTPYNPLTAVIPWIVDDNGVKCLNVSELSTLSKTQFAAFVSGMIDGDGHCSVSGELSIANKHRRNRESMQELFNWNSCIVWISKYRVSIPIDDVNKEFLSLLQLSHETKRYRLLSKVPFGRKGCSRKKIRFSLSKDKTSYWIKINDVKITTKYVEMMDIETSSHYFRLAGVKTHNCRLYDIPYLINRIGHVLTAEAANRLSPWHEIKESKINIYNKPHVVYDVAGVSLLDYLLIYRKNVLEPRENYRLDYIAQVELDERKVDYGEYGSLQELYEQNFQKFIEYNIHDVRLVDRIDAKRKLIELQLLLAYNAKVNYVDVLSQVRTWEILICNHLLSKNIVTSQKEYSLKTEQYAGAYVMEPEIGMHEWIVSFDINSLYPAIIAFLNIGFETYVEIPENIFGKVSPTSLLSNEIIDLKFLKDSDLALAANGAVFKKTPKSFFTELIEDLWIKRKIAKEIEHKADHVLLLIENELRRKFEQ